MTEVAADDLTVVVIAVCGGATLDRALEAVAWAPHRVVLDPTGCTSGGALPSGVVYLRGCAVPGQPGRAGWVLLLIEDEVPSHDLRSAVLEAVGDPTPYAYRISQSISAGGGDVIPRCPPTRLAPMGAHLEVRADGMLTLAASTRTRRHLSTRLMVRRPDAVSDAMAELDAHSRLRMAILVARGRSPHLLRLVRSGILSAATVLFGQATHAIGWERWILAVHAGFAALLSEARLWEHHFLASEERA